MPRFNAMEFSSLLDQLMPGPWGWAGRHNDVRLVTAHSGQHFLMATDRCGMQGAQFTFQDFTKKLMCKGWDHDLYVSRATYDPKTIIDIYHPLAQLIKRIPDMVEAIKELTEALDRERTRADRLAEIGQWASALLSGASVTSEAGQVPKAVDHAN